MDEMEPYAILMIIFSGALMLYAACLYISGDHHMIVRNYARPGAAVRRTDLSGGRGDLSGSGYDCKFHHFYPAGDQDDAGAVLKKYSMSSFKCWYRR